MIKGGVECSGGGGNTIPYSDGYVGRGRLGGEWWRGVVTQAFLSMVPALSLACLMRVSLELAWGGLEGCQVAIIEISNK